MFANISIFLQKTAIAITTINSVATSKAWVILIFAALWLFCDRWILATTDTPTPNVSARPVVTRNNGETILMAASALLPTPCPTNIPSATVKSDANDLFSHSPVVLHHEHSCS